MSLKNLAFENVLWPPDSIKTPLKLTIFSIILLVEKPRTPFLLGVSHNHSILHPYSWGSHCSHNHF